MSEDFLNDFRKKYGRPLRVLHIGNIANNAYNNSKIMQKVGIDSVVLCNDYYHIMGCPEWEDCELISTPDHNFPIWKKSLKSSYQRPSWFIQGPIQQCFSTLQNYFTKSELEKTEQYVELQRALERRSYKGVVIFYRVLSILGFIFNRAPFFMTDLTQTEKSNYILSRLPVLTSWQQELDKNAKGARRLALTFLVYVTLTAIACYRVYCRLYSTINKVFNFYRPIRTNNDLIRRADIPIVDDSDIRLKEIRNFLSENLPREILNTMSDEVVRFLSHRDVKTFKEIVDQFDIVQGYAYDGIWPLILGFRPYVAYEHGTIRTLPFELTVEGQMTKLTYSNADHVVITNADNIVAAKRLNLQNFNFIPHPIYEIDHSDLGSVTCPVKIEKGTFYIFAPARHQWDEDLTKDGGMQKGNHFIIYAFAEFLKVHPESKLIFVSYGINVQKSKNLISSLGIEKNVIWIEPVEVKRLVKLMISVDVIIDQFQLGAFGGIPPRALSLKKPLITMYNEELHNWCFDEHPPFFRAGNSDEILSHLKNIFENRVYRDEMVNRGYEWYLKYHSNKLIVDSHLKIYERVLRKSGKI